ncbi:uncharacterized protein LOC144438231 isoform X2 [Glandiceps talaboti]
MLTIKVACSIHVMVIGCVVLISIANDATGYTNCNNSTNVGGQTLSRIDNGIPNCGGGYTDEWGVITSPDYSCTSSVSCFYNISVSTGNAVLFTTLDFQQRRDCEKENISVYGGRDATSSILEIVCVNQKQPVVIISKSSQVFIVSNSYHKESHSGLTFQIEYYSFNKNELDIPTQGDYSFCKDHVAMALSGTIHSPERTTRKYQMQTSCKLLVVPSKGFQGISIDFYSTELNVIDSSLCENEWISVTWLSSNRREIFCRSEQSTRSLEVNNNGRPILLEFYSNLNKGNAYGNLTVTYTQFGFKNKQEVQYSTCVSHDYFNCDRTHRNSCIPISGYCDGKEDCPNGSDEEFCSENRDYFSHFHGNAITGTHSFAIILGLMLLSVVVIVLPYFYYRKYVLRRPQPDHEIISQTDNNSITIGDEECDCEEARV